MTREQLARASGISSRTLARRLHPAHPVPLRLDELDDIAAALGCTPVDLLRARPAKETR
jgi:DNA-binding Xre family transcriptional regulator